MESRGNGVMTEYAGVGTTGASTPAQRLPLPAGTLRRRIAWVDAAGLATVHILALLALVPWFFSWTGVILAMLGFYVFGGLGIALGFHRLLTHRGLVCPKWLEHTFAILGVCSLEDTPARWVAAHRRHHQHADEQPDPHSPLVNLWWAPLGWLVVKNTELTRLGLTERYAKDILRDPLYLRLEGKVLGVRIVLISWGIFFAGGIIAELLRGGSAMEALQFGLSLLIWGVFLRTVLVWHVTWSVNSVTHLWGYRNYETDEDSRNNIIVGLIANGEGWHNNHHADPRSARHGHRWWEMDNTYLTIRFLAWLGLASDVVTPTLPGSADLAAEDQPSQPGARPKNRHPAASAG